MDRKIYSLLGFAQKAGKLVSGENICEKFLKQGKVFLMIVTMDASESTKSHLQCLCAKKGVEYQIWGNKISMGVSIGKSPRVAVAVLEQHFAGEIMKLLHVLCK